MVYQSRTTLTLNADIDPLMRQFHKPTDEKRMVVLLQPHQYADWLTAPAHSSMGIMVPYPADLLNASAPPPREGVLSQ
jgi:putative SOS response-associated peptidase YedK